MKRYQCHKQVFAAKILSIADRTLYLENGSEFTCPWSMLARILPVPGDYLVTYDDGYQSVSPGKAFEEGYSEIEPIRLTPANDPSPLPQLEG